MQVLLEFLCSETADEADITAVNLYRQEDEEAAVLAEVKTAFGAKHVIRVCSSEHKASVLSAARRLLEHSAQIQSQVNLEGASIAIDDCYQVCCLKVAHSMGLCGMCLFINQCLVRS